MTQEKQKWKCRGMPGMAGRGFFMAAAFWTGLSLLILIGLSGYEKIAWATGKGRKEFQSVCIVCHDAQTVRNQAQSPEQWRITIDYMLKKNPKPETESRALRENIASYLISKRSADGRTLFNFRCGKCHSRDWIDPFQTMDPEALGMLVSQHVAQNNFAIQTWEGNLIQEEILRKSGSGAGTGPWGSPERQQSFQRFCGICHTAGYLFDRMCRTDRTEEQWREVTQRMIRKSPEASPLEDGKEWVDHSMMICSPEFLNSRGRHRK